MLFSPKGKAVGVIEAPATAYESQQTKNTKKQRILDILASGVSLNRFQAESHGDHCLHSTIAALRDDGVLIVAEWESVPTRFGVEARVKRYHYVGMTS